MRRILLAGVALLGMVGTGYASPNLVADPGFELNNGSWTLSDFYIESDASYANSGSSFVDTGCVGQGCVSTYGSGAYIAQTLATTAGQSYTLSFYVAEDGGPTSEMTVFWDGGLISDVVNPANDTLLINENGMNSGPGYVEYTYTGLVASGDATVLEINGRQDPAGILFDDFSVTADGTTAVVEPASIALLGAGLFGAVSTRRRRNVA